MKTCHSCGGTGFCTDLITRCWTCKGTGKLKNILELIETVIKRFECKIIFKSVLLEGIKEHGIGCKIIVKSSDDKIRRVYITEFKEDRIISELNHLITHLQQLKDVEDISKTKSCSDEKRPYGWSIICTECSGRGYYSPKQISKKLICPNCNGKGRIFVPNINTL